MALRNSSQKDLEALPHPDRPQSSDRKPKRVKRSSDVTVIQDIVKRKRITFLKSSHLFSQEEQLFGGPSKNESPRAGSSESLQAKARNRNMIKQNLEEKKKIEGAIEKMSTGGDRLILETIGR
jgi:hypothetical protein